MALRKKTLAIPLTGPLERRNGGEDLTANLTALPAVPRALNVYRSRTGEWKQRPGHVRVELDSAVWLDEIVGAATVSGQLRLFGSGYQYAKSNDGSTFLRLDGPQESRSRSSIGGRSSLLSSSPSFLGETTRCQAVDVAVGGGIMVVVTRNAQAFVGVPASSRLGYSAFRVSDGSPLIGASGFAKVGEDTFAGGLSRARVVYSAAQSKFVILLTQPGVPSTAATTLTAFVCSAAGLTSGSEFFTNVSGGGTNVATDLIGTATSANAHFDVMVEQDVGDLIIAYRGTGSNTRALRFRPSTAAVTTGPVTVVAGGDVAANSLAWVRADTWPQTVYRLLTAINGATGVVDRKITKATLLQSAALTVQASPGAVGSVVGWMDSGLDGSTTSGIHAMWDVTNAAPSRACLWTANLSTTWSAFENTTYGVSLRVHGHPFVLSATSANVYDRWAIPLCSSITDAGKIFIALLDSNGYMQEHLFTALDGKSDTAPISSGNLGDVASYGGEFYYGVAEWLSRSGDPSLPVTSEEAYVKRARVLKFKAEGNRACPISLDASMALIPGSSWTKSNGTMVSAGPWPDSQIGPPTSVTGVAAGGPLTLGDFYYTTLPVIYDDAGRRWAGIPSLPVKGTLTGVQNGFNVTLTNPLNYNARVVVEAYRTKVNGTQSFRFGAFSPLNQTFGSGTFITDVMADSDLEKGLPLYTDTGELLHVPPPPSHIAWVAGQRILVVDSERPSDVWASSEFTPGEGPWFHPDVRVSVPGGEEIVAGAFMDGRSFLFTRKSIFALAGPWPGRTGAGQLPEVQRVATGVGGYSPESTVVTAEGIWFYSEDRGQCLLNRGLAVVPAGKIVDGVITAPPVAAIQAEGFDQARFYQPSGVVAVYDQVERQWAHWQIDTDALGGETVKGAFVHNRDVYVFTATKLFKEDATALDDAGQAFPVELDARLPIGPPGGKVRVYRLVLSGLCSGDTTLTATIFNDFGNIGSGEDVKTAVIKPRQGETTPAIYEQTFRPKRGRCDSMLLRLSYPSTDPGITFRALAAEIGAYNPATVARPGSSRQA